MAMGSESILKVEARAMLEGLFLAWDECYKRVEVESDNALLINLLQSGGGVNINLVEIRLLHQTLRRNWTTRLRQVVRELNTIADFMTKHTTTSGFTIQLFRDPLTSVRPLLHHDSGRINLVSVLFCFVITFSCLLLKKRLRN